MLHACYKLQYLLMIPTPGLLNFQASSLGILTMMKYCSLSQTFSKTSPPALTERSGLTPASILSKMRFTVLISDRDLSDPNFTLSLSMRDTSLVQGQGDVDRVGGHAIQDVRLDGGCEMLISSIEEPLELAPEAPVHAEQKARARFEQPLQISQASTA